MEALAELARETYGDHDPAERFTQARPIHLEKRDGHTRLRIDLPNAEKGDIDVAVHGDELLVGVRDAHRRISLPASVAGAAIRSARLEAGVLEIVFEPGPGR